ncbi:MAG: class I SAM-dependent methyltransferase [Fimbriimonas sp.]
MNPTERFSDRVRDYVRYRPTYPPEVIDLLQTECGLQEGTPVADVGAGTGILTRDLLDAGAVVYAVEPNDTMRKAGEEASEGHPRFRSIAAPAEATTLPDECVDIVTCAQAWHWFRHAEAKVEFQRILRPGGWLFLVWNERSTESTPFLTAYEEVLKTHAPEYLRVRHQEFDSKRLGEVFAPEPMLRANFPNGQQLDREGFLGRVMSSSYAPKEGDPLHEPLMAALGEVFDRHHTDGEIEFRYTTECYFGRLKG